MNRLTIVIATLALTGCGAESISPAPEELAAASASAPLPPSTIVVPITVPMSEIRAVLETQIPSVNQGQEPAGIGGPVRADQLSWAFRRSPLAVSAAGGRLVVNTTIGGFARVAGEVRVIRGDLGRLLGRLNPTNIPFSAHVDLQASASASAKPVLVSGQWRINPDFQLSANVTEAQIPIAGVTSISVRGKIQPKLKQSTDNIQQEANRKIIADPFLENAARKIWSDICKTWPLPIRREDRDESLFLRATPSAIHLANPVVSERGLELKLGLTSILELGERYEAPKCEDFPKAPAASPTNGFFVSVPVQISWETLSQEGSRDAARSGSANGFELTVERVVLRPNAEKVQASVSFKVRENRWFGASAGGTLHLSAKPELAGGTSSRELKLSDIQFEQPSQTALDKLSDALKNAILKLAPKVAENVTIPLARHQEIARQRAEEGLRGLRERKVLGDIIEIDKASVDNIDIARIDIGEKALTVLVKAKGEISVKARVSTIQR